MNRGHCACLFSTAAIWCDTKTNISQPTRNSNRYRPRANGGFAGTPGRQPVEQLQANHRRQTQRDSPERADRGGPIGSPPAGSLPAGRAPAAGRRGCPPRPMPMTLIRSSPPAKAARRRSPCVPRLTATTSTDRAPGRSAPGRGGRETSSTTSHRRRDRQTGSAQTRLTGDAAARCIRPTTMISTKADAPAAATGTN